MPKKPQMVNPFLIPGKWYKANLHTHTSVSDGILPPRERVAQYRRGGYSVLALTDHWTTQDIDGLSDNQLLVLSGMEFHPPCADPPGGWWHFVALNVPRSFKLVENIPAEVCLRKVRRAGGECFLAHPSWCGQQFHDWAHLKDIVALEVYNATCAVHGRPSSESDWSVALDRGWRLPGVASDDCHHKYDNDVLESWTWLKMPRLSPEAVLDALRTGACYASCGPVIRDFRVVGNTVRLRCSPAAEITFIGPPGLGTRRRAEPGKTITSFTFDASGRRAWPWRYVRATVTDARGRQAWANPIYLS